MITQKKTNLMINPLITDLITGKVEPTEENLSKLSDEDCIKVVLELYRISLQKFDDDLDQIRKEFKI